MKFLVGKTGGVEAKLIFENNICCDYIAYLKEKEIFSAKAEEVYYYVDAQLQGHLYIGMGEEEKIDLEQMRKTFFKVANVLIDNKVEEITLQIPKLNGLCNMKLAQAISEGMMHACYRFDMFKSDKKELPQITVNYNPIPGKEERAKLGIEQTEKLMEAIFLTRNIVNQPANYIYPETLANIAKEELEKVGVKVTVHNKAEIEKLNMAAFLSVARASAKEPKLIVMEYNGNPDSDERIALVGKGLTYDSGGYALKPATGMVTMFCDMGGAGTVIGAMHAIANLKAKVNVVAVVAACENMISGDGYKNGDIISSMSGKTIEIVNTDAEGRLTLADAVYYAANHLGATKLIDLATLTGACLVALGEQVSAVVSNNDAFYAELQEASFRAGEDVWMMPNMEYFRKMNDSKVADLKNSGGRFGGTISAGLFVGEFLCKDIPWMHIDIAGTAYIDSPYKYLKEGATGTLVKSLYYLLSK